MIATAAATFTIDRTIPVSPTDAGSVALAIVDLEMRRKLELALSSMRWRVLEASTGAEAMRLVEEACPEAIILDGCFPDLDADEVASYIEHLRPTLEVLRINASQMGSEPKSPRRNELLLALREAQEQAPAMNYGSLTRNTKNRNFAAQPTEEGTAARIARNSHTSPRMAPAAPAAQAASAASATQAVPPVPGVSREDVLLPGMIGRSDAMRELAMSIQLVAPRKTTVLIEGETGTGKEVVANALHRSSKRAHKPFVVLNCAAIPEALLEAELFGHTRGAFTGAVQSRVGRIESADGGTLFLDEIGEMPLGLQAKMLRFLECGEIQRIGDNLPSRVDVRVIAATHQPLEEQAEQNKFRLDLYHRLAVFPIEVPALRTRLEDVETLANHFLTQLCCEYGEAYLSPEALDLLEAHDWPGNVRELMHVIERAVILANGSKEIRAEHVRVRRTRRVAM